MIHVTLYFAPENIPIALKACRALFDEAWEEPGLDFCQIVQSADEPGIIRIQEAWNASRKYLEEVMNSKMFESTSQPMELPFNKDCKQSLYLPLFPTYRSNYTNRTTFRTSKPRSISG